MSLLESGMWKIWKSSVANQHGMKCVQVCLDYNLGLVRITTTWELDEFSTDCQFLCNLK